MATKEITWFLNLSPTKPPHHSFLLLFTLLHQYVWVRGRRVCVTPGGHFWIKSHVSSVWWRRAQRFGSFLCFQQIPPSSTKLIRCDWPRPPRGALHCSGRPLARSVSCAQTKLSCRSGRHRAPLCWEPTSGSFGIYDFIRRETRNKVGHWSAEGMRDVVFAPD